MFVILRIIFDITTFILTYVVEHNVICQLSMSHDENWYTQSHFYVYKWETDLFCGDNKALWMIIFG